MRIKDIRRKIKFIYQRFARGYSDDELWSLDATIAKFALPRLKGFKASAKGYPYEPEMTPEKWDKIIDEMVYAMEAVIADVKCEGIDKLDYDRMQRGLDLFGKYFCDLWT